MYLDIPIPILSKDDCFEQVPHRFNFFGEFCKTEGLIFLITRKPWVLSSTAFTAARSPVVPVLWQCACSPHHGWLQVCSACDNLSWGGRAYQLWASPLRCILQRAYQSCPFLFWVPMDICDKPLWMHPTNIPYPHQHTLHGTLLWSMPPHPDFDTQTPVVTFHLQSWRSSLSILKESNPVCFMMKPTSSCSNKLCSDNLFTSIHPRSHRTWSNLFPLPSHPDTVLCVTCFFVSIPKFEAGICRSWCISSSKHYTPWLLQMKCSSSPPQFFLWIILFSSLLEWKYYVGWISCSASPLRCKGKRDNRQCGCQQNILAPAQCLPAPF